MIILKFCGTPKLFILLISATIINVIQCDDKVCNRRPLGTNTEPLPPDDRFQIEIPDINDNKYIPNKKYTVRLFSKDGISTFIAFTISARGSERKDKNHRKEILLKPGIIEVPIDSRDAIRSPICDNSVIQTDITPKTSVEVIWIAPPKDNNCVTIFVLLAIKPDVWYDYKGPLSKRVCEDRRNMEDMQPTENDYCHTCDDARYLLTFDGIWSYNTHPNMFPRTPDLAEVGRFSDVVGASHSSRNEVYEFNNNASPGLKMLAEQGNTTQLELQIMAKIGMSVRTLFKASRQEKPNMKTSAMFRVTRIHHRVSLVAAILPSPDWFVGVANMELCDVTTGTWSPNLTLNVYPLDAGTDSGTTFLASNDETMPPQPISSAEINKAIPREQVKPFAKLRFELIRTYSKVCSYGADPDITTDEAKVEKDRRKEGEDGNEPTTTTTTSRPQYRPSPTTSQDECTLTEWDDWWPCENECVDGKITGTQMRFRYHKVDGVITKDRGDVSDYCWDNYNTFEMRPCSDDC